MEKLRARQIAAYVRQKESCSFGELMEHFGISSATVHRYADELARRDAFQRVRGGLVFNATGTAREESSAYLDRVVTNRAEKVAAARGALAVIDEGDIVFLDSSTTVNELALLLRRASIAHLTIVTNSVSIIQDFRKFPAHYVLIGLGGAYDAQLNATLGAATLEQLAKTNITKAFVSCFGIDHRNVTTNHERQAELLRHVLETADRRYLLADKSKFGRIGLYRIAARGGFDRIFS